MKILYVITLPDVGGAQTHLVALASAMKGNGHDVCVLVGKQGWLTEQLQCYGICFMIVNELVREISVRQDCLAIKQIRSIIKFYEPDILHCHSTKAGVIGRIAAWLEGVPGIFTVHGWAFTEGVPFVKRVIYSVIENFMLNITSKCLCVSEYDRCLAKKWFLRDSDKIITIHNGISELLSDVYAGNTDRKPESILRLIMVGRFSKQKAHLLLIKAVKDINKKYPDRVHLVLVGDGDLLEEAKEYVLLNRLGNVISFLGKRTDVSNLLRQADVFCLISNYEGLPISIIEAMRAGLPVIASDVGGNNELVSHGVNGYLVPRGEKISQAIESFLNNNDLIAKFGKNGQDRFKKDFTLSVMIQKIEQMYNEVLKKCL